ncbi:hypothetical protein [Nocardioides marmorisolisilvae]|uniref:hypothetical protein n=1 Tax=Nocardioides marmorisolisilvae TaxID=1542737 RepID=UPI0011CDF1FB|nr:hypothetical protein [Nocardioides marmorisolisilvae]
MNSGTINAWVSDGDRRGFLKVGFGQGFHTESLRVRELYLLGLGPPVLASGTLTDFDAHYYLTLEIVDHEPLDQLLLDGSLSTADLDAAISGLCRVPLTYDGFVAHEIAYVERLSQRWAELLTATRGQVSDVTFRTANEAFENVAAALSAVSWAHLGRGPVPGDAHFGNIWVNRSTRSALFVDPASFDELPISYDLGKLLQSVHLGYDRIMSGGEPVDSSANRHSWQYRWICSEIVNRWGVGALSDALVAESVHAVCLLPHHLHEPERFALLAQGALDVGKQLLADRS